MTKSRIDLMSTLLSVSSHVTYSHTEYQSNPLFHHSNRGEACYNHRCPDKATPRRTWTDYRISGARSRRAVLHLCTPHTAGNFSIFVSIRRPAFVRSRSPYCLRLYTVTFFFFFFTYGVPCSSACWIRAPMARVITGTRTGWRGEIRRRGGRGLRV